MTPKTPVTRHEIFQTSLMSALLDGVYEGETQVRDLLGHGSFGIGTFDALDGEMLILGGVCYQLRADGGATEARLDAYTPYAVVTNFVPDISSELPRNISRAQASAFIDHMTVSENYMYALCIEGQFRSVTTRTVVKQQKPYRPMVEATDDDAVVEHTDVRGVVVGFRTPLYEKGIGVPGCHAHFITEDRHAGGHVLDFQLEQGSASLCLGTDLHLQLPLTDAFQEANLTPENIDAQLNKTEAHHAEA